MRLLASLVLFHTGNKFKFKVIELLFTATVAKFKLLFATKNKKGGNLFLREQREGGLHKAKVLFVLQERF